MAREGGVCLPGGHIPQLEGPVLAPRHDAAPVRAKRYTEDDVLMARKGGARLSRGYIPQLEGPVLAARHHTAPIRTKRHTADLCTVMLGSRALPDWLEGRGGVSQEVLDFLVFRVTWLQQHR